MQITIPTSTAGQNQVHVYSILTVISPGENNTIGRKKGGGPPKKPQQPKKLQVKTRKWVKKKNGLFGWITSVGGPGKSEVPPKLGGGDKIK